MKKILFLTLSFLFLNQYTESYGNEKAPDYASLLRLGTFNYFDGTSEEESIKTFVEMCNDTLHNISHIILINKEGQILWDGDMISLETMSARILSENHLTDKPLLFVLEYQLSYKSNVIYKNATEAIYKIKSHREQSLKEKYPSIEKEKLFKKYPTLLADTDINFGKQVRTALSEVPPLPPPPLESPIKFVAPIIIEDDEPNDLDEIKSQEELSNTKVAISIADIKGNDEIHNTDPADVKLATAQTPKRTEEKRARQITASTPQLTWPPRSYPLNIPYQTSKEVDYYWGIQRITCIGRATRGYKFRISGTANHDFESNGRSVDLFYITPNNRLQVAGAYLFPKIQKGQKFSFEIVSAITGYSPAKFKGFFIHDEWLSIPDEEIQPDINIVAPTIPTDSDDEIKEVLSAEEIAEKTDDSKVYTVVETLPQFPGGMSAMMSFLARNVHYPAIAIENGIQGRVLIEVTIDKDGSVTAPKVIHSVDPYLDKEALRVVKLLPKFTPGKQNDNPVKVFYTIPISFKLQ